MQNAKFFISCFIWHPFDQCFLELYHIFQQYVISSKLCNSQISQTCIMQPVVSLSKMNVRTQDYCIILIVNKFIRVSYQCISFQVRHCFGMSTENFHLVVVSDCSFSSFEQVTNWVMYLLEGYSDYEFYVYCSIWWDYVTD